MLTVHVIDQADEVVAEIHPIQASVSHSLMREGGWEVLAAGTKELWQAVRQSNDYWVILYDTSSQQIHGGPIRDRRWKGSEADGVILLSGGNANWYVNTTNTLPVHTQPNYPGASAPRSQRGYTRSQQHGSRSIYELVEDQHENTGLTYRNRDLSLNLASIVDTGFEPTSIEAEPFENLLGTIRRWGLATGVIAECRWRGATTSAELLLRLPTVRTFRLWSQDDTDVDWEWFETADTLTHAWVGGAGDGVNRTVFPVAAVSGPASWGINIERFISAGSTSDADLLEFGRLAIADNAAKAGLKTRSLTNDGLELGVDYQLGDIASVVFLGVEYLKVITDVEIEWSSSGKVEGIEVGEPALAIYNQPGVALGEQPAVAHRPSSGLAIGELRLTEVFEPGDGTVSFAVELVYVEAEGTVADQAGITVEYRVDGGAWVSDVDDVKTGNVDYYYDSTSWVFTRNVPAFNSSLEYRASLAKTGETTVYSPVVVLAAFAAPVFAQQPTMSGAANAVGDVWTVVAGNAVGDPDPSYSYQWRVDGVDVAGEAGVSYTVRPADVGGVVSVVVTASNGVSPDATAIVSNGAAVADPNATTGGFWLTEDGGYWLTEDGGFWLTEDQT